MLRGIAIFAVSISATKAQAQDLDSAFLEMPRSGPLPVSSCCRCSELEPFAREPSGVARERRLGTEQRNAGSNNVASRIATSGANYSVRIWSAASYEEQFTLVGHTGAVGSVAFSPDGRRLGTASEDNTARIWEISDTGMVWALILPGHTEPVNSIAFAADGITIGTASDDGTAKLWSMTGDDPMEWLELTTLKGHEEGIHCIAFSPDSSLVATASIDWTVKIWTAAEGSAIEWINIRDFHHDGVVSGVAFSPDGSMIATASQDMTAKIWSITGDAPANWTELKTLKSHTDFLSDIAFSPDGCILGTASHDSTVTLWNVSSDDPETWAQITNLTGYEAAVSSIAFSPDGCRLGTTSYDGTARIWTSVGRSTWVELASLDNASLPLYSIAFSQAGSMRVRPKKRKLIQVIGGEPSEDAGTVAQESWKASSIHPSALASLFAGGSIAFNVLRRNRIATAAVIEEPFLAA